MSFQIYSLLAQTEGAKKEGLFWKGARKANTLQDYDLVDIRNEKVSPFVKFEINPTPHMFFIRQISTVGHGVFDKLMDRFQDLSKVKDPAVSKTKA